MEDILYRPTANHARLSPTYTSFAIDVSTSKFANVLSKLKILANGPNMADEVVEMLKMFRLFPLMYIMNVLIATCWPGFIAIAIAFCFLLATNKSEFRDDEAEADGFKLRCSAFCTCD